MQLLENAKAALRRFLSQKPEDPEDPYALVGAPTKPRPPLRSASVAAPLDFEEPPQ